MSQKNKDFESVRKDHMIKKLIVTKKLLQKDGAV